MALTPPTAPTDVSAHRRKLPREYTGDHISHDFFRDYHSKVFLKRNMTKALNTHAKRQGRWRRSVPTANSRTATRGANSKTVNLDGQNGFAETDGTLTNFIDSATRVNGTSNKVDQITENHDTSTPAAEAMSRETLRVKRRGDAYKTDKRFSSRRQNMHKQNDPKSQLIIKLRNIRKKLNWKENRPASDERPRKRARTEGLDCVVHLTVWAKNPGKKDNAWEQKVARSQTCEMLRGSDDYDAVKGRYIEIRPRSWFSFRKDELTVMRKQGSAMKLVMAEDYFMEIKIVPEVTDTDWPPFPLLTRGANEDAGLGPLGRETLQDSLVAVYKKLPEPPDADAPLSICFLDGSGTLESKYGLELEARWASADEQFPECNLEAEAEDLALDDWMLDVGSKPFGRTDPTRRPKKYTVKKSTAPTRPNKLNKPPPLPPKREPKVTYKLDIKGMGEKRDNKAFQKMTTNGYKCPECHSPIWSNLEQLLLHLGQTHHQYTFTQETMDTTAPATGDATIRIGDVEAAKPRRGDKKQVKDEEKNWQWNAPSEPFVIRQHVVDGDKSWFGEDVKPETRKENIAKPRFLKDTKLDSQTALRIEHGGFLPHRYVQPFRPAAHKRKKYPNVRLRTQEHVNNTPYTSISHRPIDPDDPDEEVRSETDDEVDDSWFIAHHLEELDLHAREENWSSAKHHLAKKWDYHVLYRERSVSSRYMSDCLIRFVRMEKAWILQTGQAPAHGHSVDPAARVTALMQLMDELKDKRVIDGAVCADVLTILYSDQDLTVPEEEKAEIQEQQRREQQREREIQQRTELVNGMALTSKQHDHKDKGKGKGKSTMIVEAGPVSVPTNICAKCRNPIQHQNRRALRCSARTCSQANIWYHAKCAGLTLPGSEPGDGSLAKQQQVQLVSVFMKERLSWKCPSCVRSSVAAKDVGS